MLLVRRKKNFKTILVVPPLFSKLWSTGIKTWQSILEQDVPVPYLTVRIVNNYLGANVCSEGVVAQLVSSAVHWVTQSSTGFEVRPEPRTVGALRGWQMIPLCNTIPVYSRRKYLTKHVWESFQPLNEPVGSCEFAKQIFYPPFFTLCRYCM